MLKVIRSSFLDFIDDPFYLSEAASVRYLEDGLLVLENGKIKDFGTYEQLHEKYAAIDAIAYPDKLIMPGYRSQYRSGSKVRQ